MVAGLEQRDGGRHVTRVTYATHVEAPPERVWRVVADPRRLPRWERHIDAVVDVPPDGLREGSTYTVVLSFLAVRARVRATVRAWEPPRRAVVELSGPVLRAVVTTTVEPEDEGSVLRHEVEYRFGRGSLGRLAARSLQLLGGAELALRYGTQAQRRDAEGAERATRRGR